MGVELKGFDKQAQISLGFVGVNTLSEVMQIGYDIAYRECPKKSGTLANSIAWNVKRDSNAQEVGTLVASAPYAGYVNFGTSGRKRTPFFTNAVISMKVAVFNIMKRNLVLAMQGKLTASGARDGGGQGARVTSAKKLKVHKYLYQSRSKTGQKRYHYAKQRAGTVKFRGRPYTGRNFRARGERA